LPRRGLRKTVSWSSMPSLAMNLLMVGTYL
jgi:hypothetical protein